MSRAPLWALGSQPEGSVPCGGSLGRPGAHLGLCTLSTHAPQGWTLRPLLRALLLAALLPLALTVPGPPAARVNAPHSRPQLEAGAGLPGRSVRCTPGFCLGKAAAPMSGPTLGPLRNPPWLGLAGESQVRPGPQGPGECGEVIQVNAPFLRPSPSQCRAAPWLCPLRRHSLEAPPQRNAILGSEAFLMMWCPPPPKSPRRSRLRSWTS